MKLKKILLYGGIITVGLSSIHLYKENKFEKEVVKHSYFSMNHNGSVIAHRGFSSVEIENSKNATTRGFESQCSDGVEIDVRISNDNEVVLSHNNYVSGLGKIEECTIEEIKATNNSLDKLSKLQMIKDIFKNVDGKLVFDRYKEVSKKEEELITLDDVLGINTDKTLIIDLKFDDDNYENLYNKVNDILTNYDGNINIILQSDNYEYLDEMKNLYPNYDYQLIIAKRHDLEYLDSDFDAFCIRKNLITKKITKKLLKQNKKISIWTVNSYEDFYILYNKLDELIYKTYIITDYPDEICYLLNEDKILKKKNK